MPWVKQQSESHQCDPPMGGEYVRFPRGEAGDLWRCEGCRSLWRVGARCDACDPWPEGGRCRRGGYHPAGLAWRPATFWQRLQHPDRRR